MSIDEKTLLEERKVLEEDFNTTKDRIVQVEKDLGNMKSNLNAVYGAIQQVDKLLAKVRTGKDEKKSMPDFYINHEEEKGYPGLINLIGIESPGITASLAIGNKIAEMIN